MISDERLDIQSECKIIVSEKSGLVCCGWLLVPECWLLVSGFELVRLSFFFRDKDQCIPLLMRAKPFSHTRFAGNKR